MVARIAAGVVLFALLAAGASGFGHRLQLWHYSIGFKILTAAAFAALLGVLLAVIGAVIRWRAGDIAGLGWSLAAIVVGLFVLVPPLLQARLARQLPYIHDITTDTENPPRFVAILQERADAPNTAEYGGVEVAKQQRVAYPDIQPLVLHESTHDVFLAALETVGDLGWAIVESDPKTGRIEASDRTFWYGFIDDVVIRIASEGAHGARVDVRSVSRVGKSDIGANAKRIRLFFARLAQRVQKQS